MKKFYSFLIATVLMLAIPMGMWGQTNSTETFNYSDYKGQGTSSTGSEYTMAKSDLSITNSKFYCGSSASYAQFYASGTSTITPASGITITQIVLTASSTSYNGYQSGGSFTASTGSVSGNSNSTTVTWTGSASSAFTIVNTKQIRWTSIEVAYTSSGTGPTTYAVTFDAGAGTFVGNTDFPNASNTVSAGTYTLPSATPASGYTFNGWVLGENTYQGSASYTVSGDAAFTASFTQNGGGSGGTATLTQSNLGLTGSYTANTPKTIDGITYVSTDLMKSNDNIQAKASTGTIKNTTVYPGNITSVAITHSGTARATTINGSADGTNWTQVATGSGSITADFSGMGYKYFQITRGSNAAYWEKIDITYEGASSIATPTFSPAGGTYTTAQNVTITCETEGASIYYTTDGTTPTNTSLQYTSAINVTETTTIKAIAYVGDEASSVASATYVLPLSSMQAIFDKATAIGSTAQTVNITFNNWVVSGKSASYAYVTDGTKGFVITNYSGHGFNAGDVLSGTVSCSLRLYYGYANLQNFSSTVEGLTVVSGGTVETANIDMADLSGVNSGALVHYDNLTCRKNGSNFYLGDGTTEIQVYTTLYSGFSNTLADGKLYNITGVYQQYNTTKEICPRSADDIEEVIITNPTVTVTPSTINAPFAGAEGTLALTYENIEEFISFDYYFCDANGDELEDTDPDYPGDWIYAQINEENDAYTLSYIIDANDGEARTTYMKVYTFDDNEEEVYAIVTVNQAQYVVDYATLPFAYDGNGTGTLPAGFTCDGLSTYNSSPKMQFNSTGDWAILKINERPGILTFDIKGNTFSGGTFKVQTSEDGVTYTDLKTYTTLGDTQSEEFTNLGENVRYIKWIYTNKSSGNVALGNIALAKYVAPTPYNLTVSLNDNVSAIYVFNTADQNNPLIAGGAAGTVQVLERTSIMISPVVAQGCILASLMVNGVNVIDQLDGGAYTFSMPSENVAITATAMVTTTYTLATTIESGRHYIITNGNDRAMGAQKMSGDSQGNNRTAVEIYINLNDVAQVTSPDVFEFVINGPDANGFYTIYDAEFPGYLYAAGSTSSNHMKTQTFCDNRGQWSISFDEDNAANIVANFSGTNARNTMRYNENSDIFSCYASGNQGPIYLYVKDNDTNYEFYKDIAKYTTPEENQPANGWNLIASPVASVTPSAENGLLAGTYDLYYFDQTGGENGKEWKNYKADSFSLVGDKGYLYANSNDVTLKFTGTPNTSGEVPLTYSTGANENMRGWNLVGNPFGRVAYLSGHDFYRMNDAGTEIVVSTTTSVNPMEGIFVKATDANDNSITFSTTAPEGAASNENQNVVLNVVRNRGTVIDRAIVSFNDGAQLPKLTINENSTKLYIPQDDEDYAIVRTEAQGEMPVNFKAHENGTYTLSIEAENVEMNYLHLIDNMTGADIDLLANPSYTFNAKADDYTSRFRLVFSANNVEEMTDENESFAFINNGNLIVNGTGTLQVFDALGRQVLTKELSTANCQLSTANFNTGVYVLRLMNGNDVMTQKIIVK